MMGADLMGEILLVASDSFDQVVRRREEQVLRSDPAGDFMEGQKTVPGKVSGIDNESAIFTIIALIVLD